MGVGTRSKAWRFTDLNKDYTARQPCRSVMLTDVLHSSVLLMPLSLLFQPE